MIMEAEKSEMCRVSQGCKPRESPCSSLKVIGQEGLTLQMESKGSQLDNSLLFRGRWGFAAVVVVGLGRSRSSTDWTRPLTLWKVTCFTQVCPVKC